jgi:hypothetical protein
MSQSTAMSTEADDPGATLRRDVDRLLDEILALDAADDAVAALYRVIMKGRRKATNEAERDHLPPVA